MSKNRYQARWIDPRTGEEEAGNAADHFVTGEYTSAKNFIRFGLRRSGLDAGQWNVYTKAARDTDWVFVTIAYRQVEREPRRKWTVYAEWAGQGVEEVDVAANTPGEAERRAAVILARDYEPGWSIMAGKTQELIPGYTRF